MTRVNTTRIRMAAGALKLQAVPVSVIKSDKEAKKANKDCAALGIDSDFQIGSGYYTLLMYPDIRVKVPA